MWLLASYVSAPSNQAEKLYLALVVFTVCAFAAAAGLAQVVHMKSVGPKRLALALLCSGLVCSLNLLPLDIEFSNVISLSSILAIAAFQMPRALQNAGESILQISWRTLAVLATVLFVFILLLSSNGLVLPMIESIVAVAAVILLLACIYDQSLRSDEPFVSNASVNFFSVSIFSAVLYWVAEPWSFSWWLAGLTYAVALCFLIRALVGHLVVTISALEESGLLEATLEHSSADALVTIDATGNIVRFNLGAEKMFGYSKAEVLGRTIDILMPDDFNIHHGTLVAGFDSSRDSTIVDKNRALFGRRRSGETFPMILSVAALQNGSERMFTSIIRDTTEQHAIHQSLSNAKAEAEEANRAKSEFLSIISHELMTPMHGIIGMLNLLKRDDLTAKQQEKLAIASGCSEQLLKVLHEILEITRLDSNTLLLKEQSFDLDQVINQIADNARVQLEGKPIRLLVNKTYSGEYWVKGDPDRVRQVLENLLSNALKYTAEGEIHVGCERQSDTRVSFVIEDTGIGIDHSVSDHIFKPFTQADSSTSRAHEGAGLGLPITAKLCSLMGGSIDMTSEPGKGSRFVVELELNAVDLPGKSVAEQTPRSAKG